MSDAPRTAQLEALLFVASKPLSVKKVAELLHCAAEDIDRAAEELRHFYHEGNRGIQLLRQGTQLQLATNPQFATLVSALYRDELSGELTRPSLETLTIIAYRGPIRRVELDQIRGVNCTLIVRNLLVRGLIQTNEEESPLERAYTISMDCLRHLGLSSVEELPDYESLHQDPTMMAVLSESSAPQV